MAATVSGAQADSKFRIQQHCREIVAVAIVRRDKKNAAVSPQLQPYYTCRRRHEKIIAARASAADRSNMPPNFYPAPSCEKPDKKRVRGAPGGAGSERDAGLQLQGQGLQRQGRSVQRLHEGLCR
jgi:hypothetical protein